MKRASSSILDDCCGDICVDDDGDTGTAAPSVAMDIAASLLSQPADITVKDGVERMKFRSVSDTAPPGPATVTESFQWVADAVRSLSVMARHNLMRNLAFLHHSGHCSGMGSLEQVMHSISLEASSRGQQVSIEGVHSSDILISRQEVLLNLLQAGKPTHVHGAMEERLPSDLRARVEAVLNDPVVKKKAKESATETVHARAVLMEVQDEIFELYRKLSAPQDRAGWTCDEELGYVAWCYAHNKMCKLFSDSHGRVAPAGCLTLHASGTSCEDTTTFGKMQGSAGPSVVSFAIWLAERVLMQEAIIVHECTDLFDPTMLARKLSGAHRIWSFLLCPHSLGFPVRRNRRYTVCIRKDHMMSIPMETFLQVMGRRLVAAPDIYYCMDSGECADSFRRYESVEKASFASRRRIGVRSVSDIPWVDLLGEYQRKHLEIFEGTLAEPEKQAGHQTPSTNWIVDLDNHPTRYGRYCRSACGELLPCHVSHGCYWHIGRQRPLLAHEVLLSQGSAVAECVTQRPDTWPLLSMLQSKQLRLSEAMSVGGLAWHIPTIGKIIVFVLASIRPAVVDWKRSIRLRSMYYHDEDECEEQL